MSDSTTCGACAGLSLQTPGLVSNLPGLNAIAYRVGTQPTFLESMLAGLATSGQPALYGLTTRNDDDFTIALLDAWATVADVLTFYQERIANESYLRTAIEQLSVIELARLIGYELRPGVAADVYLSFIVNSASPIPTPNATAPAIQPPVMIPTGTQVQSVPAPGQQAQTFETIEGITARVEWNALTPRLTSPQVVSVDSTGILFRGLSTALNVGDIVLIVDASNQRKMRKVAAISPGVLSQTTSVTLADVTTMVSDAGATIVEMVPAGSLSGFGPDMGFADLVSSIMARQWEAADILTIMQMRQWSMEDLVAAVRNALAQPTPYGTQVYAMRKQALVFGYNAPLQVTYNSNGQLNPPSAWQEWTLTDTGTLLYLDAAYSGILAGSHIGIQQPDASSQPVAIDQAPVFGVISADVGSRTAYGLSTKTTTLSLDANVPWSGASTPLLSLIRQVTVYAQSELLTLADTPDPSAVTGNQLVLNGFYPGLLDGQVILLSGSRSDLAGTVASEAATLQDVSIVQGYTVLTFVDNLTYSYVRSSVTINANVAMATHGMTIKETLGGGDATQVFQSFQLKQSPLTYITAATPAGIISTLVIYVNDLLWKEVPYFYGHGPGEMIYITRQDASGMTTVTFGDGVTGARLPTGAGNIKATYRQGIGLPGLVGANQLTQLTNKPPGVKSVTNSLPANGAANAEGLSDGRMHATLTIMTLDRVVSLEDYQDFAAAYAGIGKALATWTWHAQKRCIYLTLAGVNGAAIDVTSTLYTDLKEAILEAGDPDVPVTIVSYQPIFFLLQANIIPDPIHIAADVQTAVEKALLGGFSFAQRAFGQPVALSEVIAVAQDVTGVVAVDMIAFNLSTDATPSIKNRLDASMPQPGAYSATPAQLLMIDPSNLQINLITS
ncbi:putative baseplate assembly protein [Puia dinghuensis]|uniref:Putative baseplate assembly protein n=1 Tax=Puia dinghuensis TaxID=1792502 RepID=A0A8J2U9L7_9BACT|nr:putative baseplate assembly protein [Puia dinghuensis]GGA88623.1 putative baseplate assembly protein [Puia dinghuensis]